MYFKTTALIYLFIRNLHYVPCLQIILSNIGESLPDLLSRNVLKRREVPGFLEEEVRYPKESLACMCHLLFVDHIAVDIFPAVLRWREKQLTVLIYICIMNQHRTNAPVNLCWQLFACFFQSDFCSSVQHGIYRAAVKQVLIKFKDYKSEYLYESLLTHKISLYLFDLHSQNWSISSAERTGESVLYNIKQYHIAFTFYAQIWK